MLEFIREHADDGLILAGCGFILYGTNAVAPLLVPFVAGLMLIIFGVLIGLGGKR